MKESGLGKSPKERNRAMEFGGNGGVAGRTVGPYGLLRYEGEPSETLAALELRERGAPERVVHLGSFSKVFAPGVS